MARSVQSSTHPRSHALARPHVLRADGFARGIATTRHVELATLVDLCADLVDAAAFPTVGAHALELVEALHARAAPAALDARTLIDVWRGQTCVLITIDR